MCLFGMFTQGRKWIQNLIFQEGLFSQVPYVFVILFNLRTKRRTSKSGTLKWSKIWWNFAADSLKIPAVSHTDVLLKWCRLTAFMFVVACWLQLLSASAQHRSWRICCSAWIWAMLLFLWIQSAWNLGFWLVVGLLWVCFFFCGDAY